jgi:hypothetical protein
VTASAETLHLLAHQAQLRGRTAEDWWDNALDTALAAVAAVRHPPAYREHGDAALDRLRRWRRDGEPRRISADAAALALAAAAAVDLARRDRDLERDAIAAVENLAGRAATAAPALHVALCAWALDRVVPDRQDTPWPQLRAHVADSGAWAHGLDIPLRSLTRAIAAERLDASPLVRALLTEIPASPGVEDGAVLLWVLTVAVEQCAAQLPDTDSGLQALADRRTELASRLALEIDPTTFQPPNVGDFDPDADLDGRQISYLSPMEALLIDISLASTDTEAPWLRFEEAAELFGDRARVAERKLARRTAALVTVIGVLAGSVLALALTLADVEPAVAVPAGITVIAACWLAAAAIWHRNSPTTLAQAFAALWATCLLAAAFDAVNQALTKPLVPDAAGWIAGALVGIVAVVLVALTTRSHRS